MALALRWSALCVPHFESDEPAFESVAQSLLMRNGYTSRRVGFSVLAADGPLCLLRLGPDAHEHGKVLDYYAAAHQDVVDDHALSVRPPLFPAALAASVALLGSSVEVVARPVSDVPRREAFRAALERPHPAWIRAQLPVALPSLIASLAVCVLAFFAHRGGALAATLGALAVATAPLDVWCAHRATADALTAALVSGSAVLLASAGRSNRRIALAGVLGGLAVLTKPSGVLLAPAYAAVEGVLLLAGRTDARTAVRRAAIFAVALGAAGLWWAAYQLLGPGGSSSAALGYGSGVGYSPEALKADWVVFVRSRPFWIIPASTAALSPVLGAGMIGIFARARRDETAAPLAGVAALFLAVTVLWVGKENRFLLPAYAIFAAGAAWLIERALDSARGRGAKGLVIAIVLAALAGSAWYARAVGPSGAYELTPLGAPSPL